MEKNAYLRKYGIDKIEQQETPTPTTPKNSQPQISQPPISSSVQEMRERLEVKKLEMELQKLEKPDTNIDYYQKMLELQQQHFNQLLQMTTQQNDLKLEIEKLKLVSEGDEDGALPYLQMLAPLLPQFLNKNPSITKDSGETPQKAAVQSPPVSPPIKEEKMTAPTNLKELEEYKQQIREGKIGLEQAYQDFLGTPYKDTMTRAEFEKNFNELRKTI